MSPVPGPGEGLNAAVAAELRAEQGRKRVSVQALAERSQIPYGSLRRYLNAERHIDVTVLAQIAAALDVEVKDLVRRAEQSADTRHGDPGHGFAAAARDIGGRSRGQQRRHDQEQAAEPPADDPHDIEPR